MTTRIVVVDSSTDDSLTSANEIVSKLHNTYKVDKIELLYVRVSAFNTLITASTDYALYLDVLGSNDAVSTYSVQSSFFLPAQLNSSSELVYSSSDYFNQIVDINDRSMNKLNLIMRNKTGATLDLSGKSFVFVFKLYLSE